MSKKNKSSRNIDNQTAEDVLHLLGNPCFKRFLYRVLEMTHPFSPSFTGNSGTFFAEGERSIGLQVIDLINEAAPGAFPKLLLEMQEQEQTTQRQPEQETSHE